MDDIEKNEILKLREERNSLSQRAKNLNLEIENLVKAQGNLYQFQEKVERQRTIYEQLAHVAHEFNQTLKFESVVEATVRFVLDHLNFERCVLALWDDNSKKLVVKASAGYFEEDEKRIQAGEWRKLDPAITYLSGDHTKVLVSGADSPKEADSNNLSLLKSCLMDQGIIYGLGRTKTGEPRGFLAVGNQRKNQAARAPVKEDSEIDAIFSNITSQIVAASNALGFIQEIQRESDRVKVESEKVQSLLNNMNQAVFNIDFNAMVIHPASRFTQTLFAESIIGKSIFKTLYKDVAKDSEIHSGISTVINTVFGEDELQWELVNHLLPTKVKYLASRVPYVEKTFKVSYAPIWDHSSKLEKIMFVIEDVTELERLEASVNEDRRRSQIIQEISSNDILNLGKNFFERANLLFEKSADLMSRFNPRNDELGELMRNLHSLKGNARMFGFKEISREVHKAETEILTLKNKVLSGESTLTAAVIGLHAVMKQVEASLKTYGSIAFRFFGVRNPFASKEEISSAVNVDSQMVEIHADNLRRLEEVISGITSDPIALDKLRRIFGHIKDVPIKPVLSRFQSMVIEVSGSMGKKINYNVTGDNVNLRPEIIEELQDSLVHLIRNSIDHGIESPEERIQSGKNEVANLEVKLRIENSKALISIHDDGRGIDSKKVVDTAIQKGLLSKEQVAKMGPEEILDIIYLPGFSTKKDVTELSGRGVGLDQVKKTIEKIKGNIKIETQLRQGTAFHMEIPIE